MEGPIHQEAQYPWSPKYPQGAWQEEPMAPAVIPPNFVAGLFTPSDDAVPIIHPEFKPMGRLWVPLQWIYPTCGLNRYMENHPHPPSLCMLFQKGRCNSLANCNQIHVELKFAQAISQALTSSVVSNCCFMHGDLPSNHSPTMATLVDPEIVIEREGLPPLKVPHDRLCMTMFWTRVPKHKRRPLVINAERVCNLHQQHACKFGVECRNVHVCREFMGQPDAPPAAFSAPSSPLVDLSPQVPRRPTRALAIVDPVSLQPVEVAPLPPAPATAEEPVPDPDVDASTQLLLSFPMLASESGSWRSPESPLWNGDGSPFAQPSSYSGSGHASPNDKMARAPGRPKLTIANVPPPTMDADDQSKDVDDFSSLAQELKSIQDEINEVGDEMKGRLEVRCQEDSKATEPSSPATFYLSEISPASPFFMAPSTVSAFEYANQAAVSCAFSLGTGTRGPMIPPLPKSPEEPKGSSFFYLAEVMPASPFFFTASSAMGFDKPVICALAAEQKPTYPFDPIASQSDTDSNTTCGPFLSDKESSWSRLVPL